MIAELACATEADATTALLRAVYALDTVPPALAAAPVSEHIVASTPTGDAQLD